MAIELHHLHPSHDDELSRLKARIAELERMDTEHTVQIAKMNGYISHLEEELEASKRKEKESRELAEPYTLYCEASADVLRKALGEYRWRRTCDERPPEWSCVIVYFHDEESREEQYRLAVYSKENGWEVDDEEVYKTAEIEAWHPLPMPPEENEDAEKLKGFLFFIIDEHKAACRKHPKFCDEIIPPGFDFSEEEKRWKKDEAEKHYAADLFNEEFYEAMNAYQQGDKEHALQELAQCGAVILRIMETIEKEIKNDEITEV